MQDCILCAIPWYKQDDPVLTMGGMNMKICLVFAYYFYNSKEVGELELFLRLCLNYYAEWA